jgi:site-specific recombinase XerD
VSNTERVCVACGQRRLIQARGRCPRCYQTDPAMVHRCAEALATRLDSPPQWLAGFAVYLAARLAPTRAVGLLHELTGLLTDAGNTPTTVLQAARRPPPAVGALARALEAFFVASGLALPLDTAEQAATLRRSRRVAEVPDAFHAAVVEFEVSQLESRDRARRAATKPRSNRTLEINLVAVRDLARFFTTDRPEVAGWSMVTINDIEAFLATIENTGNRARQLHALEAFFRFARRARHILIDPTRELKANSNSAFHGATLEPARQRELFRRWTTGANQLHPHEPAVGLLGLLHGTSVQELRSLRAIDVNLASATATLGHRPHPTPLDPATAAALHRCIRFHNDHANANPYLLVSQKSKTIGTPVSGDYLSRLLAPASVNPMQLRTTRLAHLVTVMDPALVAAAFGLRRTAALHYLADTVDETRLDR